MLERSGVKVSADTLVGELRAVDRALVAIVRGLLDLQHHDHGILVLDEPTAYLPATSVEQLFATMRSVAAEGTAVVFVTPPPRRGHRHHRSHHGAARRLASSPPSPRPTATRPA